MVTAIFSPLLMWAFMMVEGIFIFPLLLVMGLFLLAPMPVMLATVNEIKSEQPAFLNGIYMMINFIINSAAVMLIGFMGDRIGLDLTYKISAVVALTAIPVIIRMKP